MNILRIDLLRKRLVIVDFLFFIFSVTATHFNAAMHNSYLNELIKKLSKPLIESYSTSISITVTIIYAVTYAWFLLALYKNSKTSIKSFICFFIMSFLIYIIDFGPQTYDPISQSLDITSSIIEGIIFTLYLFENKILKMN